MFAHDLASGIKERAGLECPRLHASGCAGVVAGDFMLMRIEAGDDAGEAGAAEAARHITASEGEAFFGQLIQVRRLKVGMPHETVVTPQMVV